MGTGLTQTGERLAEGFRLWVEWPADCPFHAASDLPLSVFNGDDIPVFARLHAPQAEALTQPIRLWGQLDGVAGEVCLAELRPAFIADEGNTLARLAANRRHEQLRQPCPACGVPGPDNGCLENRCPE